jgi:hypothetical protein
MMDLLTYALVPLQGAGQYAIFYQSILARVNHCQVIVMLEIVS